MEDNRAPTGRNLMDATTFKDNFGHIWKKKTYMCHKVEVWEGNKWVPVEKFQDFLCNQGPRHAELCFLDLVRSWHLDEGKQYRLTCYISWSPCPDCAQKLVDFLGENSHVRMCVSAARIYTKVSGYEDGLRKLRDAVDHLAIMTVEEYEHCWEKFVDSRGQSFETWTELERSIGAQCQKLQDILGNQGN